MLKDDLETIVHPRPSMKDMSPKQLSVIERDMLLDRSHVSGEMFIIDLREVILSPHTLI